MGEVIRYNSNLTNMYHYNLFYDNYFIHRITHTKRKININCWTTHCSQCCPSNSDLISWVFQAEGLSLTGSTRLVWKYHMSNILVILQISFPNAKFIVNVTLVVIYCWQGECFVKKKKKFNQTYSILIYCQLPCPF